MSILSRLSNLLKSNLNAAVDKLSDPAKEIDLLITEMEDELGKLRIELRDQLVREKLGQKKVDEEYRSVQKWQDHAERAVQAGDDELAKEALKRLADAEKKLQAAEAAHAEHSKLTAKLLADLRAGETKLTEIKGKRETLKARAREAQKQTGGGEGSAFDRFSNLVSEIEDKERQAEAMAELNPELGAANQTNRDRETEARFDRLLQSANAQAAAGDGSDGALVKRTAPESELDRRLREMKEKLAAGKS